MVWAYAVFHRSNCMSDECFLIAAYETKQEAEKCPDIVGNPRAFIAEIKSGDVLFPEDK